MEYYSDSNVEDTVCSQLCQSFLFYLKKLEKSHCSRSYISLEMFACPAHITGKFLRKDGLLRDVCCAGSSRYGNDQVVFMNHMNHSPLNHRILTLTPQKLHRIYGIMSYNVYIMYGQLVA